VPRVHVVSDVHGRAEGLAAAAHGADALVCLGDLIAFVDYDDHSRGVLGALFGADAVGEFIRLRTDLRFDEARTLSRELWSGLGEPAQVALERQVHEQYAAVFGAFAEAVAAGVPVFLTHGNDDLPRLWQEHLTPGVTVVDGAVADVAGTRWGFVGGIIASPMGGAVTVTAEAYDAQLAALGPCDVLATHIPPDLPWMVYDTVARRYERGSSGALAYLAEHQPTLAVSGHVHQPLSPVGHVGRTVCVNVGHFRATGQPYVVELP